MDIQSSGGGQYILYSSLDNQDNQDHAVKPGVVQARGLPIGIFFSGVLGVSLGQALPFCGRFTFTQRVTAWHRPICLHTESCSNS
jgi:hypothetical protein